MVGYSKQQRVDSFKRNQTSIQVQKKDHVYKLMLKHGAKTTLVWINFKTQTKQCKNYSKITINYLWLL